MISFHLYAGERMKVQMLILFVVTIIGSAAAYGGSK